MADVKSKPWTPGPWRIHGQARVVGPHPKTDGRTRHVATAIHDEGTYVDEQQANARLIASAPELYDALHSMLELDDSFLGPLEEIKGLAESNHSTPMARAVYKARIALRKAGGTE